MNTICTSMILQIQGPVIYTLQQVYASWSTMMADDDDDVGGSLLLFILVCWESYLLSLTKDFGCMMHTWWSC